MSNEAKLEVMFLAFFAAGFVAGAHTMRSHIRMRLRRLNPLMTNAIGDMMVRLMNEDLNSEDIKKMAEEELAFIKIAMN